MKGNIIDSINRNGRVDKKIDLTEIFGKEMRYPKFWHNFVSKTEIDVKH